MEIVDVLPCAKQYCEEFLNKNRDWTIIIWWATATWKSKLSLLLSDCFPVEIISSDSRQIFRWMDVWTDKVSLEWRKKLPHYQIDIVNPDEVYTAWQRKTDAELAVEQILLKNKNPIIGGLELDEIVGARINLKNFLQKACGIQKRCIFAVAIGYLARVVRDRSAKPGTAVRIC